ncbi:hypothetical protein M1D52_07250 [Olivibacter sp. SA151]|uniref:hypothetical protein n=1 Tax=Olivibacter jilunii TaxID=985016 RepID=UPI003F16BB10
MTFLYTARGIFDRSYENGLSWDKYIAWSKLIHLTEVVSLDSQLNELLVEPDYSDADDWNFIHTVEHIKTGFFSTQDYVFRRIKVKGKFNMLRVVVEPDQDCNGIVIDDYEFIGYDLLDQYFDTSALTNCGGFNETFLSSELNNRGLIDDFSKAYDIKEKLLYNNPNEHHADTNVIAVWRHCTIGR